MPVYCSCAGDFALTISSQVPPSCLAQPYASSSWRDTKVPCSALFLLCLFLTAFSWGTCCAALCSTSPAQPPRCSPLAARECWAVSFPSCSLLSRPSWTTSTSSRTSPGTTVWPTCWKPLSGCSAQIPSSSTDAVGCSSCLHCASRGTGEWSWTPLAMCQIREAAPFLQQGREGGSRARDWAVLPPLPGMGVWGQQGLELCSAGLCWPPGVVLMLNFYK